MYRPSQRPGPATSAAGAPRRLSGLIRGDTCPYRDRDFAVCIWTPRRSRLAAAAHSCVTRPLGFLLKNASREQLIDAIRTVPRRRLARLTSIPRRLLEHVATTRGPRPEPDALLAELTPREREMPAPGASALWNRAIG